MCYLQPPPKDPPWFTDDKCHMSVCAGVIVITKSLCAMKGASCPAVSMFCFSDETLVLLSVVFTSVSQVIRVCFGVVLLCLVIG